MRAALIILLLLSACGGEEEGARRQSEGSGAEKRKAPSPVFSAKGELISLTGLYENGARRELSQMCVIERPEAVRFALLARRPGDRSCSGGGTLRREGATLRFVMAGESDCAFAARLDGRTITLSGEVPAGCSYYCTEGASLAGAAFTLSGASIEDARRARDLVGEPLCGER